jgi:hypothetical protein
MSHVPGLTSHFRIDSARAGPNEALVRIGGQEEDRCVDAQVVYFDGCPSWRTARERLGEALTRIGRQDVPVGLVEVRSAADAMVTGFAGSPTILVDGEDLFPSAGRWEGLACRVYWTRCGPAGVPTVDDLAAALSERG